MYKDSFQLQTNLSEANALYRQGRYSEALNFYLKISTVSQRISASIRLNIELCARKIEAMGGGDFADHPRYFRYGYGHSFDFGAKYFDNKSKSRIATLFSEKVDAEDNKSKRLKIVFVADSNPLSNTKRKVWGAETSAGFVAKYGKSIGHDVIEVDPYNFDKKAMLSADLLVLRSIDRLNNEHRAFLKFLLFEKLKPYVTYQHDYAFCKFRNSIKCMGSLDSNLCTKCTENTDQYYGGQINFYTNLLQRAALNIFISHPQRHIFGEVLGAAIDPSLVILPPVDPDVFRPLKLPRDPKLIVNTSGKLNSPNKGFANVAKYINNNPGYTYELYTEKNQELIQFAAKRMNVILKDPVDNHLLPSIYSRASSLIVMPSVMEPAGRTPIEAALCGCKVISNNKLGVGYFDLPLNSPDQIRSLIYKSLDTLWFKLASIAKG